MKKNIKTIIMIAIIVGALSGAVTTLLINNIKTSDSRLFEDYYATETKIHVSPHHIRKAMDKGESDFIIVDLRSAEEYEKEHIIGAINIPAYKTPDKSAYSDVERIVNSFSKLPQNKDIIVYCYSIPCMTGRKIGNMLAEHDIYVQQLGIGWNEWRYYWNLWNHEHEWELTNVEDYIYSGSEPGIPIINVNSEVCDIKGDFGC
ncbi:hypothetical protein HN789_01360 [archaeon]|jgi:rhodanese-related sulfurtransferase|nr:hypothetical protein [archaeon]MBT4022179.1 hypothetical protein [archaeon]MBT4272792.1 hypothetical protein [archaeon]MBT4461591.1 hypothetical protein [archaeon]MBT4857641.1 hypothetical protein [archaeon]